MANLQYMPGDPRLVDQLVYELKSKGIFDQFRKECIADVDTRPAYQNLRQRVETSVATFLSHQVWKPDLNKNQLREKLRKHLLDGNYLEQGVERIVDQVVNPKVASVFIPQVEDLVYNYLGIPRKKPAGPETSIEKTEDLLPTDLEAVSPGSVKSNDEKDMDTSESKDEKMEVDDKPKADLKDDSMTSDSFDREKEDNKLSGISELTIHDSDSVSIDKSTITIPLPAEIKLENIPAPENSPPNIKDKKIDLEKIDLPQEPNLSTDIPLPDEIPQVEGGLYFKPIVLNSEDDDDDSSNSSIKRNMSPLTPIRNFNNENSCDAQQAFENDSDSKGDDKKEPSSFRFTIESKSPENSSDAIKPEKKEEPSNYKFSTPSVNAFNTPMYDDSSSSNNLQIDYESDANSKIPDPKAPEPDQNSVDSHKKDKKDDKKSSHKSSHRSRDSHKHSSSKDKRSDSKQSSSRDSSRHEKKTSSSKDDKSKSSDKKSDKEKSSHKSDRGDKKDSRESSKLRSFSHKDSKTSSHKDSKHKSSSSSKHSSKDDKKSSSSSSLSRDKEKDRNTDKSKNSKDKAKDNKSSSRDKDRKSSSKKLDDKENKEKKEKKEADDHYSLSGRGNPNRRSTDRDSNDGSSSSKGSHNPSNSKTCESKKASKSSSKSGSTSSSDSTSPSDGVEVMTVKNISQSKPVVRVDTRLENPISTPPRLPFVPDVTLKKPKFAANMQEAKQLMKMRKFMEDEQKKMNQEAALLLEFQANVRPSLSQVYSSIPGPELEFACMNGQPHTKVLILEEPVQNIIDKNDVIDAVAKETAEDEEKDEIKVEEKHDDEIAKTLIAMHEDDNNGESIEYVEANIKRTNASVLEDLTDQEGDLTIIEENSELPVEEMVIVMESNENDPETEQMNIVTVENEQEMNTELEVICISDESQGTEEFVNLSDNVLANFGGSKKTPLHYFTHTEQYESELERDKFNKFFKKYSKNLPSKIYLVNCDTYEQNLIGEVAQDFGHTETVNYFKNGYTKLPKPTKNIFKDVNVASEVILPTKPVEAPSTPNTSHSSSPIFSPTKSECSFELSSDYDAKLEEMVNKTSRQEIMEIILGGVMDESPSKMPRIDYCMEANIEKIDLNLKRKCCEVETTVNNNRPVLTPNKLRKMSGSDQISSTTEETEEISNNNRVQNTTRSKYLGKARWVGLPKPKKSNIQNSPNSDKSVENYEQLDAPNGKIKMTPRSKVQRYDTTDLYKPKLHYLSRRNNIS